MKKILFINSVYNFGSTASIIKLLGGESRKTFEVYFAIGRNDKLPSSNNYFKINSRLDFLFHTFLSRIFDSEGLHSFFSTYKLINYIKKIKPDIINLHNIHGHYLNYPLLFKFLKRNSKIKIYWTLHDSWAYTGHCAYYLKVNCNKFETFCSKCPNKHQYPKSYLIDRSKRNFILKKKSFSGLNNLEIIVPSLWLKYEVKKSFLKSYNIHLIYNGTEINNNFVEKDNTNFGIFLEPNIKYILGVASKWEERKGLRFFYDLAPLLNKEYKIIIIGKVENKLNYANVIFVDSISSKLQLSYFYKNSFVFLNPTLEDNFPTTNIEALASGLPVITFDTGGSPEAIDKSSGIIIKDRNAMSIFNAIKSISAHPNQYSKENCFNRAIQFTNLVMARNYINLFSGV